MLLCYLEILNISFRFVPYIKAFPRAVRNNRRKSKDWKGIKSVVQRTLPNTFIPHAILRRPEKGIFNYTRVNSADFSSARVPSWPLLFSMHDLASEKGEERSGRVKRGCKAGQGWKASWNLSEMTSARPSCLRQRTYSRRERVALSKKGRENALPFFPRLTRDSGNIHRASPLSMMISEETRWNTLPQREREKEKVRLGSIVFSGLVIN